MTAAAAAAPQPERPDDLAWLPDLERAPGYVERDPQLGAFSVNAAGFELIAALERDQDPRAPDYREQTRRSLHSQDAARSAGLATYGLPRWPLGAPSLDTRQQVRRHKPRQRLDPGVKARQRDRYKRAAGDAIEAFGRLHLRRDPRAGLYRPRWLDHRAGCRLAYCHGCAGIPVTPGPRWRRRGRRTDQLETRRISVAEWLVDRAAGIRACREAIALTDQRCGGTMIVPQSCRVRTCPDCEASRQTRVVEAYRDAVTALDPDRVRFLTLTIRNAGRGELAAALDRLGDAITRLKRRAVWKGGRCRDRARCRMPWDPERPRWRLPHSPVAADMTSIEVTYNHEHKSWHPHAHLLVESGYIDQAELADTWEAITGDSRITWIESVRRHADKRWGGNVEAALRELLKYAAKPTPAFLSTTDPGILAELLVALRGRHLTSSAGKLYGREVDEDPPTDLVLVEADDPRAEPHRAPRVCPLCGEVASWRMAGHVQRHEARPTPARAGPFRSVLALPSGDAG